MKARKTVQKNATDVVRGDVLIDADDKPLKVANAGKGFVAFEKESGGHEGSVLIEFTDGNFSQVPRSAILMAVA